MSRDSYRALATALSEFTDQLEAEANQATADKRAAEAIIRKLFPDISPSEAEVRLLSFDVRAAEITQVMLRIRRLLADVARARSEGRLDT